MNNMAEDKSFKEKAAKDVVGIGATVYDTVMVTEKFPEEDTKQQAVKTIIQGGGPCATALVACSKLGVSAEYLGTIGNDDFGKYMLDDFKRYGVGTENIIVKDGCISFHSFVLLNNSKSTRTIVWNKGTVPAPLETEININSVKNAKVLHLDGHQLDAAIYAAKIAKENNVKVSLDAGGVYPGIERLLPFVDFLIPSEEFALKFTGLTDAGKAAEELYHSYKPEFVIITQGSKGGFIYDGKTFTDYPAYKVDAVDSNGAGDVFHGAFVAAYVKGMNTVQSAYFASAVSALKCTKVGARLGVPGYDETIQFLRRNGYNEL